jgi:hypothetical protein
LARESVSFWSKGFATEAAKKLENFGFIQLRPGGKICLLAFLLIYYHDEGGELKIFEINLQDRKVSSVKIERLEGKI